jgi:hypothetical protein
MTPLLQAGFQPLEEIIYTSGMQIAGDPVYLGLLVLGFFFGFVLLQGVRTDVKVLVMIPALFLATGFIPWLYLVIIVIAGVIFYLGISRFFRM